MREKLNQIKSLVEDILASMDSEVEQNACRAREVSPDLDALKGLLDSPEWPEAVFQALIADDNSELDKQERAQGISDIMLPPLKDKKFLDFGCGEGHVAKFAANDASVSVGYDIEKSPKSSLVWEESQGNFLLTSDFDKVSSMGPFDVVLLYDVVDHAKGSSPSEILSKAASVLSEDGRIFMRCHPWCGRHGGHAYRAKNKAFVHLVFDPEELGLLGINAEPTEKVTRPLKTYGEMIKEAGLKNDLEPEIDSQEVEDFFRDTPIVRDRILKNWGVSEWSSDPPQFQMSQCFLDYVLKKKSP